MDAAPGASRPDWAADIVRCIVLYSLAEVQSGHATTIRVTVGAGSFSVADDGRGHAIERVVDGVPYLKLVYEHVDYPFGLDRGPAVQLQGIATSLITGLCRELSVTVQKKDATHRLDFHDGRLAATQVVHAPNRQTGNAISGSFRAELQSCPVDADRLEAWLKRVAAATAGLTVEFNGRALP